MKWAKYLERQMGGNWLHYRCIYWRVFTKLLGILSDRSSGSGAWLLRSSSKRLQTFWRYCNWNEIMSALHARVSSTQTEKAQIAALTIVEVVFTNMIFLPEAVDTGHSNRNIWASTRMTLLTWNGFLIWWSWCFDVRRLVQWLLKPAVCWMWWEGV